MGAELATQVCRLEFRIQLTARQVWRLLITPALQLQRPATPEGKLDG